MINACVLWSIQYVKISAALPYVHLTYCQPFSVKQPDDLIFIPMKTSNLALNSSILQFIHTLPHSYNHIIHNRKWAAINQAYLWQNSQARRDWSTTTITTVSTSSWLKPKLDTNCFSEPFSRWIFARCSKPRWMRPSFSPWSCNVFSKLDTASISLLR